MIELKHVSKVFASGDKEDKALDNISLTVPEGTIYGVIGPSGAGKSTLIRCVNLLERPTSGSVRVAGSDLMMLSEKELRTARHNMGMIFQHFNLLTSRTVFDNIALPLELAGYSTERIAKAVLPLLELTELENKKDSYPSQLSGGQKQRVAIARALASKPRVLLCDEATSALDPKTTRSILALIKDINLKFKITILMITHEMDVVKSICDRVAVLSRGQLIEENSVEQFFISPSTALAQEFVRSATHEKPVTDIEQRLTMTPRSGALTVVRLTFVGQDVGEPLITQAARIYDVDFNILQADVETVGNKRIGFLMIEVVGNEQASKAALAFFEKHVKVEVLGYVA
ncbi:MAG: methionine ABC transporter ATP-binding protein [Endozoicomonas sp. (ex Botrylloides leachii)]|nr:methionine ABC transporter ATP-binding protein [Endozoicomonas sp. (ex Botrylloides leachii)]